MSEMATIYEECIALYPDADTQTAVLIQCIADGNQQVRAARHAKFLLFFGTLFTHNVATSSFESNSGPQKAWKASLLVWIPSISFLR